MQNRSKISLRAFTNLSRGTKMSPPILYTADISPPCRSVLLTAAIAGIDLDLREISILDGEHRKEEFLKMNPQHTIPTLDDNGLYLTDSHAIVTYLVDKYAKDDFLYPKDIEKRALVNQMLHFSNATLFSNLKGICYPMLVEGLKTPPPERITLLRNGLENLEKYLGDKDWLVGDTYTLADICNITTVSGVSVLIDLEKFPKLTAWIKRCEDQIPEYAAKNGPGNLQFMNGLRERMSD